MMRRSMIRAGLKRSYRYWHWLPSATIAAVSLGCASTDSARRAPTPRQDFPEYRHLVVLAMKHVDATLRALEEVTVQANRNPRSAYEAFAKAVGQLEVGSIRVRERAQAMRARGAAYFEHWEETLATARNDQVRKLAEEHKAELKEGFERVRQASQQAREAFRGFLSDLQKLRAVLEAEPTLARIDAQKSLILAAEDKGRQVQQALDRVLAEMNSTSALLTPPGTTPVH